MTYIYRTRRNIPLFDRLISTRHFEKVKVLFDVQTPQDLKNKLTELKTRDSEKRSYGYSRSFEHVTPLTTLINIEKIGSER